MGVPTYQATLDMIKNLSLDDHLTEDVKSLMDQQLNALRMATPGLSATDQDLLFRMIWDHARVAGYFQARDAQISAQESLMAQIGPRLQEAGILPTCDNPECDSCRTLDHKRNPKPAGDLN